MHGDKPISIDTIGLLDLKYSSDWVCDAMLIDKDLNWQSKSNAYMQTAPKQVLSLMSRLTFRSSLSVWLYCTRLVQYLRSICLTDQVVDSLIYMSGAQ